VAISQQIRAALEKGTAYDPPENSIGCQLQVHEVETTCQEWQHDSTLIADLQFR